MIRKAERADLPECVRVIRNSFQTVADEFGFTVENAPRFTAFATTEERLAWQMDSEHRLMYLDEEGGTVCGYYSLKLNGDGTCELGNLSVLPEYRHRGIGGALLKHSMETATAQNCGEMKLSIVEENTVLRKWYERNGAVHTGTEKFDFFPFTCGYMTIGLENTNRTKLSVRYATEADREFWFSLDRHLSETVFARKIRDQMGYILASGDRPVAVLRYSLFWDSIPFCTLLYVKEEEQRKGYGRILMEHWEQDMKAKGYGMVLTSTQADEEGQYFYRAIGYTDCGQLNLPFPGYEQPTELILGKSLQVTEQ